MKLEEAIKVLKLNFPNCVIRNAGKPLVMTHKTEQLIRVSLEMTNLAHTEIEIFNGIDRLYLISSSEYFKGLDILLNVEI